jgi:hypothetical protein
MIAWGVWPRASETQDLMIPGVGVLSLEWTPVNRTGEMSVIKLTVGTHDSKSLSDGRQPIREANYSYLTHHLVSNFTKKVTRLVEARLEIPSVDMKPRDTVGQFYVPGDEVVF